MMAFMQTSAGLDGADGHKDLTEITAGRRHVCRLERGFARMTPEFEWVQRTAALRSASAASGLAVEYLVRAVLEDGPR